MAAYERDDYKPRHEYVHTTDDIETALYEHIDRIVANATEKDDYCALIVVQDFDDAAELLDEIKRRDAIRPHKPDTDELYGRRWNKQLIELANGSSIHTRPYSVNIKGLNAEYVLCAGQDFGDHDIFLRYIRTRAQRGFADYRRGQVILLSTEDDPLARELLDEHSFDRMPE